MFEKIAKPFVTGAVAAVWLFSAASVFAQEAVIRLKDGSVLKGSILNRQDQFVKLRGTTIGDVWINKDDIASIQEEPGAAPAPASTPGPVYDPPTAQGAGPSSEQFQEYQEKIMKDPETMESIQALAANKDVQEIVSDPALREAILRNDLAALQGNPKFQKFMANPDVQKIVSQVATEEKGAPND